MQLEVLAKHPQSRRRQSAWEWCGAVIGLLAVVLVATWRGCDADSPADDGVESAAAAATTAIVPSAFARVLFPTPQTNLLSGAVDAVFQHTGTGNGESGLYGSVRTDNAGKPSFHEGIDIAAVRRIGSGKALDDVFAVADGRIAYINRHAGNSNYGIYLVLLHPDPLGEVYTLYAHLAAVGRELRVGNAVSAGDTLGRMGNTPPRIIPEARSHLHFEVGLLANRDFARWLARRKTKNPHGVYHGWNLLGVDPATFFADQQRTGPSFTFKDHLATVPVAFELIVRSAKLPDVFAHYPALWERGDPAAEILVISVSEGGVPLRGRAATSDECAQLGSARAVVLTADEDLLSRNGRRLVVAGRSGWEIGSAGKQWLDILLY